MTINTTLSTLLTPSRPITSTTIFRPVQPNKPFGTGGVGNININQLLALLQRLIALIGQGGVTPSPNTPTNVPFTNINPNTYANFLGNWDNNAKPVLSALVQNANQYNKLFYPAATMGNTKPYAPDSSFYNNKSLVVLGRVVDVPANGNQTAATQSMQPAKIVRNGSTLDVYYNYTAPAASGSSYSIKVPLELEIPKGNYSAVNIYENGKKIEQLNIANGQWNNVGL